MWLDWKIERKIEQEVQSTFIWSLHSYNQIQNFKRTKKYDENQVQSKISEEWWKQCAEEQILDISKIKGWW